MRRLLLMLLVTAVGGFAQDAARFDEVVQAYSRDHHFMGSVLVAKDGAVVFEKSVGWANAEWNVPNSAATKFRLGSITKQFTAAAILLLEEQGKLKLDDPLSKLLPATPASWGSVTVRQLLTHTAGVPSITEAPDYGVWKLSPEGPAKSVAHLADKPLDFTPGERFHYSNTGYLLLGWMVEQASGQSYEAFLREHLFLPLGMQDSGYDSNAAVIPQRASGYMPGPDGFLNAPYIDMHVPGGAGALYSTTGDLLRWTQGLFGGHVLKPESLEQMTTPVEAGYGFGLFIGTRNGRKVISHGGGIEGFTSHLAYYPEGKVTIAVLANINGQAPEQIAQNLAAVEFGEAVKLATEHKVISVPRAALERFAGIYDLSPTFMLTITLAGDQLTCQATGQSAFPIFPEAETKFFVKAVDAQIEFFTDAGGAVTHLVLHQNGRDNRAVRRP
jgi:CubicO group peptidase (beta-lactamase class C family)